MTDEAGAEIAAIEQTMRSDYRAYRNIPGMQARYGDLLQAREAAGAPEPRTPSAVDTEIARDAPWMETVLADFERLLGEARS